MEKDKQILSDIIVHMKYSKYLPELQRRETWSELVFRNMQMHIVKYPMLKDKITDVYTDFVITKRVLPSMRSLQFAGKAIEVNNARIFNCSYLPIDSIHAFSETMFMLLSGVGVGYSIQDEHISHLPSIKKPALRKRKFVIEDSIMGWADAVKALMKSYTGKTTSQLDFDYSAIREKGAMLVTAGGKAPGPGPLRIALSQIEGILEGKKEGSILTSVEVHDMLCYIADAVLAGGIRRSAMIAFFDAHDSDMLAAKAGTWWEQNAQRGRANNSVVLNRKTINKLAFDQLWQRTKDSKSGEPGFYLTNNTAWGSNPCVEIGLRPYQFCNLVEINGAAVFTQEQFEEVSAAASFLGTLQAGYTDFHYLRDIWKTTTEKDALIGVSMTGLANQALLDLDFREAARVVKIVNIEIANIIGINSAARQTCVKPAGTTSLVLGTSSGIHAYHAPYYIRRVQINKNESLYSYLVIYHPELVEDLKSSPDKTAVIGVPQKAPEGAILRSESAINLLERVKKISEEWVAPGHIEGDNSHNVSCTISLKDEEWDIVRDWMWVNKEYYNGISVLPYDGGTYVQAPFEDITKERYDELIVSLNNVDLSKVVEMQDNTNLSGESACSGGACEIT
jgi:ribonucleoside-triphosphate reductase